MAKEKTSGRPRVATIIFIVIIVYIICFLILFFAKRDVRIYEVTHGDLSQALSASGLMIKEEKVYHAPFDGNITFFNVSGVKVKVNDSVYALDKTGRLNEILEIHAGEKADFSDTDVKQVSTMLRNYETDYEYAGFAGIYDISNAINTIRSNQAAAWIEANSDTISKETGTENAVEVIHTDTAGYLSYSTDGYEGVKEEDITDKLMERQHYEKSVVAGEGASIKAGDPAFKLVTNELYYIYVPLTQEQIRDYSLSEYKTVYVNLKKVNASVKGNFEIIQKNNMTLGKITLNKYVYSYIGDRFADVEVSVSENVGLKIPNSAVVKRDMYVIPEEYLTTGGDTNDMGFNVQSGDLFVFNSVPVAFKKDGLCYVKTDNIPENSVLIKPESTDTYVVKKTEKVDGAFCVNTGYTVFQPVNIISRNDEYAVISESNTGISVYDRIVLNAEKFKENEIIY